MPKEWTKVDRTYHQRGWPTFERGVSSLIKKAAHCLDLGSAPHLKHKGEFKTKKKDPRKTGISRCGFTWDDAAAKMGPNCSASLDHPIKCFAPPDTFSKSESYWYGHPYMCYTDLPDLDLHFGNRKCRATGPQSTDAWCNDNCNTVDSQCDPFMCDCEGPEEDHWKYKTPEVFDTRAMASLVVGPLAGALADGLPTILRQRWPWTARAFRTQASN